VGNIRVDGALGVETIDYVTRMYVVTGSASWKGLWGKGGAENSLGTQVAVAAW